MVAARAAGSDGYGGLPATWRAGALRQQEIVEQGPSAARRAARRRRLGALEAWCRAVAGPCAPGSWQDRERAARPALVAEAIAEVAQGPRLGFGFKADEVEQSIGYVGGFAFKTDMVVESGALLGPEGVCDLGSLQVIHVAELESRLLGIADAVPPVVPPPPAWGTEKELIGESDVHDSECAAAAGAPDWLAPGVWHAMDFVAEAEAFAEGLAAG